jgi:hypothetical protein
VKFGLRHLNLDESNSCWRLTYHFGPVFEDLGDGVSTIYNRNQLQVEDTEEDENGEFHAPIQMGKNYSFQRVEIKVPSNEKIVFFIRLRMSS